MIELGDMDRRRWLWKRKPTRKSPGGSTDTSGSPPSSLSERHLADQERGVQRSSSPGRPRPPEAPPSTGSDDRKTIKDLNAKLSAALASVRANEDLVNQHNKVAEEAVSGWERAETQLAGVRQQLEATTQRNARLEDSVRQLNGALKECVRQLGQTRAEQERKVHDVLAEKTGEWEKERSAVGSRLVQLQRQLEATDREARSMNQDLRMRLEATELEARCMTQDLQTRLEGVEKEKADLTLRLLDQSQQLRVRTRDMELSTIAAEAASKQHLESVKKVAKVEAECRRLQAMIRRAPSPHDERRTPTISISASPSNNNSSSSAGNQTACLDDGTSRPEVVPSPPKSADKLMMMDDFLEMEKLAASHEEPRRREEPLEEEEDGLQSKAKTVIREATCSFQKWKVEQEREMTAVTEKFQKCQQTITSLGLHLQSLADAEEHFVLEDEKLQSEAAAESEMNRGACLQSSEGLTCRPSSPLSPPPPPENPPYM